MLDTILNLQNIIYGNCKFVQSCQLREKLYTLRDLHTYIVEGSTLQQELGTTRRSYTTPVHIRYIGRYVEVILLRYMYGTTPVHV